MGRPVRLHLFHMLYLQNDCKYAQPKPRQLFMQGDDLKTCTPTERH